MLLHYIRISLRNLNKYKTQTAISICAMAVSLTLMAVVSSIALSIKPTPLLSQPYADRTVLFSHDDYKYIDQYFTQIADSREISLILGHHFKGVEEIHYSIFGYPGISITANSGEEDERSLLNEAVVTDKDFLRSQGMRSVYTGKVIETFADNETVITEKLAQKLFDKENPIGKIINVGYFYFNGNPMDKTYIVKDVMENPSPTHKFFQLTEGIFVCEDELLSINDALCYFILKDGASVDELTEELKELLGNEKIKLLNAKDYYSEKETMAIRNAIILFLFIFVLVAFSNYLRQQTQLFRLREREVALRTCIGCQPSSMFLLFSTEILIVLFITLALSLVFISLASGFLTTNYTHLFVENNYSMSAAIPVALIAILVLIIISLIVVAWTVRRIRRDQTGLALRMKPMPRHRLRNVGLTVQMTVSIVFTCVTVLFFMSVRSIKEYNGIPNDADRYRKFLTIRLNGFTDDQSKEFFGRIESVESVEKIYKFLEYMTNKPLDDEQKDYITYHVFFQHNTDAADFYRLKSEDINVKVNLDRFAIVSEATKQTLIDRNLWNGRTVEIPHYGDYEIKGVFDRTPFLESSSGNAIVVYDVTEPMSFAYTRIITPKAGMENQVRQDIDDVIHEVFPSRIDIKPKSFYQDKADNYEVMKVMITMIYILSIISVVTTMAAVYAGVALDTRRRRKEMALRKLNGAGRKVIAMIFTRTYLWIIAVAALMALPLCFMVSDKVLQPIFLGFDSGNIIPAYIVGLLLIMAVTALTIAWKIRDIMHADPIEYLKE
ncbi:MAG: ABC transporter permease [Muribaculaceae bacterium]|nr:ABC transporter permease [Muribaculaceae bacterium]